MDSSSSSSSSLTLKSTPYALSRNWTYDVFTSFRGADVRRDFLSHIRKGFESKGIRLFNDQEEIETGEPIFSECETAIRGSKIAIVLISKNYASSTWCLNELVEIMKCRKEFGQIVIAIFYKVYPTNVRHQTGEFGKVFGKTCVGKSKEEIERWKLALAVLASLAGYDSRKWDNEAAMVETIATNVSMKLTRFKSTSINYKYFVGMRAPLENISPLLSLHLDAVGMIGLVSHHGIGKSTCTKALFDQLSQEFEGSVLIEDIKELYIKPTCSGPMHQNDDGIVNLAVERERLRGKKVLVIIDNVDKSRELDDIVKETHWFGPGSRVIVALEDKKLLKEGGRIEHASEVSRPSDSEAFEIFCMSPFGQHNPKDGFEYLAREVCNGVSKLPKGLKFTGSRL